MPRGNLVKPHLELEELKSCMRKSSEAVTKQHLFVIYLVMRGKTLHEVSQRTGYSVDWIYAIVRRYNEEGLTGIPPIPSYTTK